MQGGPFDVWMNPMLAQSSRAGVYPERRSGMRFLSIYKTIERSEPPTQEHMAAMGKLIEEMTSNGTLIATEGCLPSVKGARVRRSGGKVTVTDGPFTESKELIAGFAILEASSKEEAIQLTKTFLGIAGDGECEIRQIYTAEDPVADCAPQHEEQLKATVAHR
jgi:hypothetical protein